MKVELLASLLEKDATELSSTLKLGEGVTEVSPEIVKNEISSYIKEIGISKLSEGKKQGEGMTKRLVYTELETKLKDKFGVEGKFDDMITSLESKLKDKGGNNEAFENERKLWKVKFSDLESENNDLKAKATKVETRNKVKEQLNPILSDFEFSSSKIKDIAIKDYMDNRKFIFSGDDMFLDNDGTPSAKVKEDAEKHFMDFGKKKGVKPEKPKSDKFDSNSYSGDLAELTKQHSNAKTVEEKNAILKKMKEIMG